LFRQIAEKKALKGMGCSAVTVLPTEKLKVKVIEKVF